MPPLSSDHRLNRLPPEIWSEIFNRTASIEDATAWAEAYEIVDLGEPLGALVRARAPGLLTLLPTPTVAAFQPLNNALLSKPPDLNFLLEAEAFCADDSCEMTTDVLHHVTQFLLAFAPQSAIAEKIIERATLSWIWNSDHRDAASIAEGDIACDIQQAASRQASAIRFDLALGPRRFPPYVAGLSSVKAILLHNLTSETDLSALLALPNLTLLEVDWASEEDAVELLKLNLPKHIQLIFKRDTPSVVENMLFAENPILSYLSFMTQIDPNPMPTPPLEGPEPLGPLPTPGPIGPTPGDPDPIAES